MFKQDAWKSHKLCVVLGVIFISSAIVAYKPPRKTVLQHIAYWNRLRKFASLIQVHKLSDYFEREKITVFVPTTKSYNKFMSEASKFGYQLSDPETVKRFLLYHVGNGVVNVADMFNRTSIKTLEQDKSLLFFNTFYDGDSQVFTVNGARIISSDITASNGVVHVIDRFITPLQSTKPVAQFLEAPDLPGLSFISISMASIVDMDLKAATSNASRRFTIFAPNDSYIMSMPKYGKDRLFNASSWALLKSVFWAHVLQDQVHFIPSVGELHDVHAKAGTIRFYRHGPNVYISNNKVRARVVEPNIPVANGVVHVIDDLLFYVYRNLRQKIEVIPNIRFINNSLGRILPDVSGKLEDPKRKITMFIPTDDAFAKLPVDKQMTLDSNNTKLTQLLKDHMVVYRDRDIDSMQDSETFFTVDSKVLTIRRNQDDVYVEGGNIRAKITVPDIGCTNGIIHLISNVLFQRDFTIWEAIQGNAQLSKMKDFIKVDTDIQQTLSSTNFGPLTALLISDSAYDRLPKDTIEELKNNPEKISQAIKGSIVHGSMLSSSQVTEEIELSTISGHTMKLYNSGKSIFVTGSHIHAKIIIQDIWCSNGILHITDNILHIPTRTIYDEIALHPSLSTMTGILMAYKNISKMLSDSSKKITMFVPNEDAFTYMPSHRANLLRDPDVLREIIKSHLIQDTDIYFEDLGTYTKYTSEEGGNIFIVKTEHKEYVTNNNVKASIISRNIRCTNGIIHIIDTLLFFPYETVAETMETHSELIPFYNFMKTIDEFDSWASTIGVNQTVFVPSAKFLQSLSDQHKTVLTSEPGIIRKMFEGHFLPAVTLSERFLYKSFKASREFLTDSRYNTTFTLVDLEATSSKSPVAVDTGFTNLKQTFDLVEDGIGCSNGIIYIIDGFLNYPLHDVPDEIDTISNISKSFKQLTNIIPDNSSVELASRNTVFTLFVPDDGALDYLSDDDIAYINDNISYAERHQITERHIIEGQKVTYDEILNGKFNYYLQHHDIQVISRTNGLYLKWKNVEAKVIRENILASNGIIHIVDKYLLTTPYQTTTVSPTSQTSIRRVSSAYRNVSFIHTLFVSFMVIVYANSFVLR